MKYKAYDQICYSYSFSRRVIFINLLQMGTPYLLLGIVMRGLQIVNLNLVS